jgi:hypothetical protein
MQRPKKLCDQRLCRKTRGQNREITERTTENRGSAPYIGSLLPKGDVVSTIRGRRSGAKVSNSERDQAKKPGAISARAFCAALDYDPLYANDVTAVYVRGVVIKIFKRLHRSERGQTAAFAVAG